MRLRRPHFEFDDGCYEQEEDAYPQPVGHRQSAQPSEYPFIDAEAGVDWDASGDKETDENEYLDGLKVANEVE